MLKNTIPEHPENPENPEYPENPEHPEYPEYPAFPEGKKSWKFLLPLKYSMSSTNAAYG